MHCNANVIEGTFKFSYSMQKKSSLTCKLLFTSWVLMPRYAWQAPVLQKQPVRK